jgi:hypothetical protein
MFGCQLVVLRNISIVEIGNSYIKQDIENQREIEQRKIKTILFCANGILNRSVNTENPKGFYQKV